MSDIHPTFLLAMGFQEEDARVSSEASSRGSLAAPWSGCHRPHCSAGHRWSPVTPVRWAPPPLVLRAARMGLGSQTCSYARHGH